MLGDTVDTLFLKLCTPIYNRHNLLAQDLCHNTLIDSHSFSQRGRVPSNHYVSWGCGLGRVTASVRL